MAAVALSIGADGLAQETRGPLRFTPTLSADLTFTDNVDIAPREVAVSDFVLTLTPGFAVDYESPRSFLRGYVAAPLLLYARTGDENNEVRPLVDLTGRLEVVKDFFFVEASASVQQTYFSAFGARPPGVATSSRNQVQDQRYRFSPYLTGTLGGTTSYELRNEQIWDLLDDTPFGAEREHTNRWFGTINREASPIGWGADVEHIDYRFDDQDVDQYIELARLRAVYRPSPVWEVYVSGGYERNRFTLAESEGAIYGGGLRWRPTERTLVDVFAEHRFFGPSYAITFDHRTPLTTWNLRASRNVTTDPEQFARLPAGSFVPGILNELLVSRIPDPQERAQFIVDYMRRQNLPIVLSDPVTLYSQRLLLEEFVAGAIGLLGVRNTVVFSAYRNQVSPITGSGNTLPPALTALYDYTETGGGVVWTYQLGSQSSLTVYGTGSRTLANTGNVGESTSWIVHASVNRAISPRTSLIAGARHYELDGDFAGRTHETAVFVGVSYVYR